MNNGIKTLIGAVIGHFAFFLILIGTMNDFEVHEGYEVIVLGIPGAIIGAIVGQSMGKNKKKSSGSDDNYDEDTAINTQIDYASELSEYKKLLDVGILTQEEFDDKKREILKNIMLAYNKGSFSDKSNLEMLMKLKNMQESNLITNEEMIACKKLILDKEKTTTKKKEFGDELTTDEIDEIDEVYDPKKVWNETTDNDQQTPYNANPNATNLFELKKLFDSGVITQEEYDKKKKEFLEKL